MISFLFKRQKIVVDAFTSNAGVHRLYPIDKSTNKFPSWWKHFPAKIITISDHGVVYPQSTIKACPGVRDLYKNSFSIPMWSDLIVRTSSDGNWVYQYSDRTTPKIIQSHDEKQLPILNSYIHIKLESPWVFVEKSGINFYFTDSFYDKMDKWNEYKNIPAIVNYKYQNITNVNMFLPKVENTITINSGTPIATIIPLTEKEVVIKSHLVTIEEFDRLKTTNGYMGSFTNQYDKRKKILEKQSKCPFGFFNMTGQG